MFNLNVMHKFLFCIPNILNPDRKAKLKFPVTVFILRLIGQVDLTVYDTSLVFIIMWMVDASLIRIQIYGIDRYLPKP